MQDRPHLVARQTVEVTGPDRFACEALAARTSRAAGMLARAVERSLDEVDAPGLQLRIDRIELDLGRCEAARWEEALAAGIRNGLGRKIVEAISHGRTVRADAAAAALLLLEEFGRSGRLPWWCKAGDTPEVAIAMLISEGCEPARIRAMFGRSEVIERFINQLDDQSLLGLLQLARPDLGGEIAAALSAVARAAAGGLPESAGAHAIPVPVWRAAFEHAVVSTPPDVGAPRSSTLREVAIHAFKTAVGRRLDGAIREPRLPWRGPEQSAPEARPGLASPSDDDSITVDTLARGLAKRLETIALDDPHRAALARLAAVLPNLDARSLGAAKAALERDADAAGLTALIEILARAGPAGASETAAWREAAASRQSHAPGDDHDSVAVATSGLVIVWPFLSAFFDSVGLLDGDVFRDAAAQHRAAALLHYLATGESSCPEQELPLAKVLVGIELEAVHEAGDPLDDFATESADSLLRAVLGHAPMLGKISIAGLRQAFLTRPGSLSTRDGHWLLRVERQGIDLLLDRLPWSFAWVRLPWMPAPVQVEW